MPKNIEDIIVPDKRRSIRDIPIPEGRRKSDPRTPRKTTSDGPSPTPTSKKLVVEDVVKAESPAEASLPPVRNSIPPRRRKGSRKRTLLILGGVLVVAAFVLLSIFDGANLSYVPKAAALNFQNDTYTARKSGEAGLFYSVVKLSREKGMSAPAGAEEEVSRKASGVIVVYNDSAETQRLVENTRFESPTGHVYRIQNAITVPARRTVSGSTQPGTLEVTVYADVAGDEYNSAPTDFTVPGLKGTSRFSSVYGRSKTPISGGFIGREKVVRAEDLTRTKTELQDALMEELFQEAEAEVPADFILFRSLSTFSFEDMPQSSDSGSNITVNQRGHLYAVMFKKSDLSKFLAQNKLNVPATDNVAISSFEPLDITFASTPPADLLPLDEITFNISGSTELWWVTDEVSVRADLAGRDKEEVSSILNNYPTISSANVTVRPFWKSSLPDEPEKIKITQLKPEIDGGIQ